MARWQTRPVFVSSTFRDMQSERDWLRDRVIPELEERLRKRHAQLEVVDLRWGVETVDLLPTNASRCWVRSSNSSSI
ncbi:MAG TPA: hypothetical protein VM366_03595 [Anaerolineae bacterium]|nr:hypothetical protein [Anaerolineae bacterium]